MNKMEKQGTCISNSNGLCYMFRVSSSCAHLPHHDHSILSDLTAISIWCILFQDDPIELAVSQRVWQITGRGDYVVNHVNGNLVFKVKGIHSFSNTRKLILDANGATIATLRHKQYSSRSRWQVFRGDSTEEKDVIFSARRSSRFQTSTKLHVFFANNTSEDVCDYSLVKEGSLFNRSYKVYVEDSSTVIAQMHMNSSIGSRISGKNQVRLRVYKNVDYAFIVALMVILEEIISQNS